MSASTLPAGAVDPTAPASSSNTNLTWFGKSKGADITLYGTVPELTAQLKALDPEWKPTTSNTSGAGLSKRDFPADPINGQFNCCPIASWGWLPGEESIYAAATSSMEVGGSVGIKPYSCQILACGIWVCNQESYYNYIDLVTASEQVTRLCVVCSQSNESGNACGQAFVCGDCNTVIHGMDGCWSSGNPASPASPQ